MTERPDPLAPPEGYGRRPEDHGDPGTDCDVLEAPTLLLPQQRRCARPGVVRVWFGCENEHVGYVDLCLAHQGTASNMTICARCASAGRTGVRVRVIRRQELPAATADRLTRSEINTDTPRGY